MVVQSLHESFSSFGFHQTRVRMPSLLEYQGNVANWPTRCSPSTEQTLRSKRALIVPQLQPLGGEEVLCEVPESCLVERIVSPLLLRLSPESDPTGCPAHTNPKWGAEQVRAVLWGQPSLVTEEIIFPDVPVSLGVCKARLDRPWSTLG